MYTKIVLADDHEVYVKRMQHLFEKEREIEVVGAAFNGKDAVKIALELQPEIVLMDISMPEMNGIDATKEIRKRMPNTKVLCLTVHRERHFVLAMMRAGARGYVLKDCSFEELVKAIKTVQSGKKYISPHVADYCRGRRLTS